MRIRTIKPEFWTSDDVAALDLDTRLLFIGLWSYVDDHGRGRDEEHLIIAALFPRDMYERPRETVARVSRGLAQLFEAGLIHRYEVDGRHYLTVTAWKKHQKVDHPKPSLIPAPEEGVARTIPQNDAIREAVAKPRETVAKPREDGAPGTGEQGNRGTGEQDVLENDDANPAPVDNSPSSAATAKAAPRDDVNRICNAMADSVAERTGRRPRITRAWKDAARRMLDLDKRTESDILAAIAWSANDDFWRANILSLPKLRQKYDQLSLQAQRKRPRNGGRRRASPPTDLGIRQPADNAEAAALCARLFTPTDYADIILGEEPSCPSPTPPAPTPSPSCAAPDWAA